MTQPLPYADDDVQFPVPGMVVLSEEDFTSALHRASTQGRDGSVHWAPVEADAVEQGAIIAGRANHPGTSGILARVRRADGALVPFEGRLFGIVTEPAFDVGGGLVSASRFRIATVELSGSASWVGGDARLSGTLTAALPNACCGKSTICVPVPGGGDDPPVLMPGSRVGVSPRADDLYTARERQRPDAGTVRYTTYGQRDPEGLRAQPFPRAGSPSIPGGIPPGGQPIDDGGRAPTNGGGMANPFPIPLGDDLVCLDLLDPGCGIAKPTCGPEDIGFQTGDDGAADVPLGSSHCAGGATRPVRGLNVPEACTYAHFGGDTTDPACRGTYGGPPANPHMVPTTLDPGTYDPTNSLFCRVSHWVAGSGSPCETQTEQYKLIHTAALQIEMGGVLPGETKTRCSDTGERGIEHCVTCTADACSESVVVPRVDPTVAGGEQQPRTDNTTPIEVDETTWTYNLTTQEWTSTLTTTTYYLVLPSSGGGSTTPPPAGDPPTPQQPAGGTPPGPADPTNNQNPDPKPKPPTHHPDGGANLTHSGSDWEQRGGQKQFTVPKREQPKKGGDPVEYGDGSLLLTQTDLEFPGPVRPLTFVRSYRSASRDRSALGSNWRHNWDVRLQVYDEANLPSWLSPWCAGLPGHPTAVAVHWGDSSSDLFLLDIETRLYLPQAGSAATLARSATGWALRLPDGRILAFDDMGSLLSDCDRFGNTFAIEWEPTPLGRLFEYLCTPAQLTSRSETMAARRNALLAWLVGAGARPGSDKRFWELTAADFPMPADPALREPLEYARDYLLSLAALPHAAESIDGSARRRVKRVTDPIGRTLEFHYTTAPGYVANPGVHAFDNVLEGLVESVHGPVGTSVTFRYDRPGSYPAEINEGFLVSVLRADQLPAGITDLVAAPSRETTFDYQWPAGLTGSYDEFAAAYETSYAAFYQTFVGCHYDGVYVCGATHQAVGEFAAGDPLLLALLARNAYISDVADNILTVRHVGEVEVESRYPANPAHPDFDRVVAQRYGATAAMQDTTRIPADNRDDGWQTSSPKATISYCIAGPVPGGGDRSDAFLPTVIRDRYPLEAPPLRNQEVPPAKSKTGGCDYARMEELRLELPDFREVLPYFDEPTPVVPATIVNPEEAARLWRTPLAPEQLAGAQLWDPAHNDLISGQVPNPADITRPFVARIIGRRRTVARNNNRICAWAQRIDRDGDITYFGLNYRGLPLVEATQEHDGRFVFVDRFYNADGNLIEERRPTRALTWQPGDGRTLYVYDEINPLANRGWNAWLPVFWSRRYNLLGVEVQAAGDVLDTDEHGNMAVGSGRFTHYRYEPLFNQVAWTIAGSLAPGGVVLGTTLPPVVAVHSVSVNLFDYQELSASVPASDPSSIDPLLDSLRPWGFHWLRADPEAFPFQLQMQLLGVDVNKDGSLGNRFSTVGANRAVGVPVLNLQGRPGGAFRSWKLRWSPHGTISRIDGPDGTFTVHEFYAHVPGNADAARGPGVAPTDADVQSGWGGFVGRIVRGAIPAQGFPVTPLTPVPALAGPYAFLGIEPATSSVGLPAALGALGLPPEQVSDLIATLGGSNTPDTTKAYGFSYNAAGHPSRVYLPTGQATLVTDTDGRITRLINARGTEVVIDYDLQCRPVRRTARDAATTLLSDTLTRYDEEDNIVLSVEALVPGAATDPPPAADAAVWAYRYTPEGNLFESTDPEGLVTRYEYDAFKRLTRESRIPGAGVEVRTTAHRYDVMGRLDRSVRGGLRRGPSATQTFTYDGLDRLVSMTDERGYAWQHAWSFRDLLTHRRRTDEPYERPPAVAPSREVRFAYDDFGDLIEQRYNGLVTQSARRSPGGHIVASTSLGMGTRYTIADSLGQLVWSLEPGGSETVVTRRNQPHRVVTSLIRRDASGVPRTTSSIVELDALGGALKDIRIGGSHRIETTFLRDGAGLLDGMLGPTGEDVRVTRNLAGWVTKHTRVGPAGPVESVVGYDRRGLTTYLRDGSGQETEIGFNAFGESISARMNGTPAVTAERWYDRLGRLVRTIEGPSTLIHRYDAHHDPVLDLLPSGDPVTRRSFDDLGRLHVVDHTNPGLTWLAEADRLVRTELRYDRLDRVRVELSELVGRVGTLDQTWTATPAGWRGVTQASLGGWSRSWESVFDAAGRFSSRGTIGQPWLHTQFRWLGDVYIGRSQPQAGWQSRFTEEIETDAFLSSRRVHYRGIEADDQGRPNFNLDALKYSPNGWDNVLCALPLLDITTVRDRTGRVALETWRHGHPVTTPAGLQVPPPPRARAVAYTASTGRLARVLEIEALTSPLPNLESYLDPSAALAMLTAAGTVWAHTRSQDTEDLQSILDGAGGSRFELAAPRSPAHQLTRVKANGQTLTIAHDSAGRMTGDGVTAYTWHPDGSLATAARAGQVHEAYAYDGLGRLVGLYGGALGTVPDVRLLHDHLDPVVAVADVKPVWQAAWGPLPNQLIEWQGSGATQIPLLDSRSSPLALWDPDSASVPAVNTFTPEGRITVRDGAGAVVCDETAPGTVCVPSGLPFGFTGAFRSSLTGLLWMRARWYDPQLGQFLSMDPEWFADGTNRYEYAAGDPINRIDPSGLSSRSTGTPKPNSKPKPGRDLQRVIPERKPRARAPMPPLPGAGHPALPVPPPPPAVPAVLPRSGMSDAERDILERKRELGQAQSPRQRAEQAREEAERGWKRETKKLDFDNILATSPLLERMIYELSAQTGGNDLAVGVTGADEDGEDVSLPDRIITGATGLLTLFETASGPAGLAGGVLRRGGKRAVVEVSQGMLRPGIRMPRALPGQSKSEGKFLRDAKKFWRWMEEKYPDLFSDKNRDFLRRGLAPEVDPTWTRTFPEHELMTGDKLVHHHWGKGADTVGLPQFLHRLWHGVLHY